VGAFSRAFVPARRKLYGELLRKLRPLQQELNALIQSNREIVERQTPLRMIANVARAGTTCSPPR
jgi:hypothetical protein